jgi:hypothetical protein
MILLIAYVIFGLIAILIITIKEIKQYGNNNSGAEEKVHSPTVNITQSLGKRSGTTRRLVRGKKIVPWGK